MNSQMKKIFLIILVIVFCFTLFAPRQVLALGDEWATIGHFFSSVGEYVWKIGEALWEESKHQFTAVVFKQGLNLYLGEMARQSAEYVATGGKGQKPAFISDPTYWSKMGDNLLGTLVNEVAQEGLGVKSLCDPIDPTIRFNMLVSVDTKYKEQQFKENEMDICPLSRINERVKEASSKKLFEFSAGVKEGKPKKFKTDIKVAIVNDTTINKADGNFVCDKRGKLVWGMLKCECKENCTSSNCDNTCFSVDERNNFGRWVNDGAQDLLNIIDKLSNIQDEFEKIINAYECAVQDKDGNPGWCTKKLEEVEQIRKDKQAERNEKCPNQDDPEYCDKLQDEINNLVEKFLYIDKWSKNYISIDKSLRIKNVIKDLKKLIDETPDPTSGLKKGVWGLKKENKGWEIDSSKDNENYLGWWTTYPAKCAKESSDDFYASEHCPTLSALAFGNDSNEHYQDVITYSKRMNTYAKKIADWYATLEDMITETHKALEEEEDLPETDPLDEVRRVTSSEGSDIGATIKMKSDFFDKQAKAMEESKFFQNLQGRMNDVSTNISGITKTPSIYIDESTRTAIKEGSATYKQYTGAALADAFNIFSSTLMKKLMERIFEEGFNPTVEADRTKPFLDKGEDEPPVVPDLEDIRDDFSDLKSAPMRKGGKMSIYDEFAVCLDDPSYELPTNCLIDSNMIEAIEGKMTIGEALDENLLNPGASVGSPGDTSSLFSYANLKKLRRYRIFPLGMEIAAEKIYNQTMGDQEYKLRSIVNGFNVENSIGTCSTIDLNGSFETGESVPGNWFLNDSDGTGTRESVDNEYYHGSFSYKINSTHTANAYYGIGHEPYDIEPNTQYTVSVMVKAEAINTGSFNLSLHCHSDSGGNFNYTTDAGDTSISSASSSWEQLYRTFTTHNDATDCTMLLIFNNGGTGTVYVDQVNFVKGNNIPNDYSWESASPFCHLVDPDWVLKASTYQCDLMGYSAIPLKNSNQRQETCVDLKDCIHEDQDGNCDTWAYCTREKNVWQFNGTACDKQYASCETYVRLSDKKQAFYVSNTIDFETCTENDNGCNWYCSVWDNDIGSDGKWACVEPGSSSYPDGKSDYSQYDDDNAIFFNLKAEDCKIEEQGCNEYIKLGENINLIPNSGFELDKNADDIADGWIEKWEGDEVLTEDAAFDGLFGYEFVHSNGDDMGDYTGAWQRVSVLPGQKYTISAKIKIITPVTGTGSTATVNYYWDEDGDNYDIGNKGETIIILDYLDEWQEHSQTVVAPDNMNYVWIAPIMYGNGKVYFDNIQLEYGALSSAYKEYGSGVKEYFKTIPKQRQWVEDGNGNWDWEWKTCSVYDEADNLDCDGYAQQCDAKDIGCEIYTNISNNVSFSAVKRGEDECAPECVGYETFRQIPTNFDINVDWKSFIPSTAQGCYVPGCEEFTNLDTLNQGGEGTEYYSYLRQCVKTDEQARAIIDSNSDEIMPPDSDTCGYFYTWIGSETSGFQLKKYYLKIDTDNGPEKVSTSPPSSWGNCWNEDHAATNPYCKQFYNEAGQIYYRLYKNTITCSEECYPFRRSINQAIYMAMPSQGEMCSSQNNGCKEYKGPLAGDINSVFSDDFTAGTGQWTTGDLSSETDNFSGYSLKNNGAGELKRSVAGLTQKDKIYFVSFWIKTASSDPIEVYFTSTDRIEQNISLVNEWQNMRFGPFYFSTTPSNDEKLNIFATSDFYIDNVILEQIDDNIYLINDSWSTQGSCDIDYQGNYSQGYMIGCAKYVDTNNDEHYFKQFSKMCPEQAVGCAGYINTQNYSYPFEWQFNQAGADNDEITILADKTEYYVVEKENYCHENNKGCERLGLPEIEDDGSISMWSDVFIKNNPDNYKSKSMVLCDVDGVGCEAYSDNYYFKDPIKQAKLCEYKTKTINGNNQSGWFKKDTDQACYYENTGPYIIDDLTYGIYFPGQENYDNYVGICPKKQVGCTEFVDPGWGGGTKNLINNSDFANEDVGYDDDNHPDGWFDSFNNNPSWQVEVVDQVSTGICGVGSNENNVCYSNTACESWTCDLFGTECFGTGPCEGSNSYCSHDNSFCTDDSGCNTTTSTGTCTNVLVCGGNASFECSTGADCSSGDNSCNIPSDTPTEWACEYDNSACDPNNNQCPTVNDSCYYDDCYYTGTACNSNSDCDGNISQSCDASTFVATGHCKFAVEESCISDDDCVGKGSQECVFGTCSQGYNNCYNDSDNFSFVQSCTGGTTGCYGGDACTCPVNSVCIRDFGSCDPFGTDTCATDVPCQRVGTCNTNSNIECFEGGDNRCTYDYGNVCGFDVCILNGEYNGYCDTSSPSPCESTTNNFCDAQTGTCTQVQDSSCNFSHSDSVSVELPSGMINAYHVYTNSPVSTEAGFIGDIGSPTGGEFSYNGPAFYSIYAFVRKGTVKFGDLSKPDEEIVSIDSTESNDQWIKKSVFVSYPSSTRVYFEPDVNNEVDAYVTGLVLSPSSFAEYYYIDNNKLDKATSVSLKKGNILLQNSSDINMDGEINSYYNSFATYQKSSEQTPPGALVDAISCSPEPVIDCEEEINQSTDYCKYCLPNNQLGNDTNLILKVDRDRICGEWLTCISSNQEWDANLGAYRDVCQFMGRCNQLISSGEATECVRFVEPEEVVLTEDVYKNRDISFSGMDYSGHSLHNVYPLEKLFLTGTDTDGYELTHKDKDGIEDGIDGNDSTLDKTCRLFPEKDSPFKNWEKEDKNVLYQGVNSCNDNSSSGDYSDCQCSYLKVKYGGMNLYYNYADSTFGTAPSKACISGNNKGGTCASDTDCDSIAGSCVNRGEGQKVVGLRDYCIELDDTKEGAGDLGACVTWWPGAGMGDPDVFNQVSSAGYEGETEYFCIDASDRWEYRGEIYEETRYEDGYGCANNPRPSSSNCDSNYTLSETKGENWDDDQWCGWQGSHSQFWRYVHCTRNGNGDSGWFSDNNGSAITYPVLDYGSTPVPEEVVEHRCNKIIAIPAGNDAKAFTNVIYNESAVGGINHGDGCEFYGNLGSLALDSQIILPHADWAGNDCNINISYTIPGTLLARYPITLAGTIIHNGTSILKQLFAVSGNEYHWNGSAYIEQAGTSWDNTETATNTINAPKVASMSEIEGEITIGDSSDADVARTAAYPATLKFYAWANENQMPVREIEIDWLGTGSEMGIEQHNVTAKNHKITCDNTNFGDSSDGCIDEPYVFNRIYTCVGSGSLGWNSSFCGGLTNACCFKPRVRIKDNWGWCTNGVFDCSDTQGWVDYNGKIVIYAQ
ncbi:carbohydrate binding domain-containing protein [Patescibacteria group bacterium]|nr:carbohydrate binding domain-containing protein [Patescibacteria group bacterium]